ncbi:MAG: adenylate/guanylate cyclase domain-containing protein [Marinoscillum sp.]
MDNREEIKSQIVENEKIIHQLNSQLVRRTSEINIIQSISDEIINSLDLDKIFSRSMELLDSVFGFNHSMILLKKENEDALTVVASIGYDDKGIGAEVKFGQGTIGVVAKNKRILRMSGILSKRRYISKQSNNEDRKLPGLPNADSQIAIPLIVHQRLIGVYSVESEQINAYKAIDEIILNLVAKQIATAIDNAKAYETQRKLTEMYSRFVPMEIMKLVGYDSILQARLADQSEREVTILFVDIRNFTGISEKMSPEQNFQFLNSYLSFLAPTIINNKGFIDKYIGDAIMAIFPENPGDALSAGLEMRKKLDLFNKLHVEEDLEEIRIGIGIHTGKLMVGIIGFDNRMEGTVIGDSVNTASRIEGLTKEYNCCILASESTVTGCDNKEKFNFKFMDEVQVKGKEQKIKVYSVS